uniref:Putative NDP-hexose 3,4-isomerase n=1 Tax=Streptomyces mycarofaciens TaxID=1949 RepID=Q0PY16_STRMY|nr:putative NDP-hexose 3,4-isomerase [Streptomyces mycarofaciens]
MPIPATAPAPVNAGTRELGRRLQLTRAAQWCAGNQGDPNALILRATADPAPLEREIRARGPWFRSELTGAWVTADPRWRQAALADRAFARSTAPTVVRTRNCCPSQRLSPAMSVQSSPGYGLAAPVLSRCAPAEAPCEARTAARRLLRRLLPSDGAGFDLVTEVARPYAVGLVLRLLGVPDCDRDTMGRALAGCAPNFDARLARRPWLSLGSPPTPSRPWPTMSRNSLLRSSGPSRAPSPGPTMFSPSSCATVPPRDVERIALLLAIGTPEPAATAVANTVHRLLNRPGEWGRVRRTPAAARAVDRTLRDRPPARLESRVASTDLESRGCRIAADDHVVVLAAAGRDAPGPEPLGGRTRPHLALALPLIRLAATTAVQVMAGRLPGLRVEDEPLTRPRSPVVCACARFRVHPG